MVRRRTTCTWRLISSCRNSGWQNMDLVWWSFRSRGGVMLLWSLATWRLPGEGAVFGE